ncbi:MAG: AAA family ATPase, partial [Bacteroidales bacterium]|nr:AAA family ATPase [Bacteroidales bacterium]
EFLFDDENAMVRIDMSEYQERHTVSRLVGAPPGYVGYDEGGQLTEAVRRKPYSVILLDEIEKAHPDVFNVLLQVLDDGRLTDNKGRTVDFKNTILIMTSNLKPELVKETFRPEFLNRIDETIIFHTLTPENIRAILMLQIGQLQEKLKGMGVTLKFSEEFIDYMSNKGYDPAYGARPVKRVLQKELIDELAKHLLDGSLSRDSVITATFEDGVLKLK